MSKSLAWVFTGCMGFSTLLLGGCANTQQIMASDKDNAVNVAEARGRFELNCPKATGTILSSNMLQPAMWGGMERAEYTVGIEGCGKRATYLVVCQVDSPSCFAASGQQNMPIAH